jgi:uncharacterized protein YcgI (DUF1989 family)
MSVTGNALNDVLIKGGHGGRIEVGKDQILEIQNVKGQQICDFFAFNLNDISETLSPAHTRSDLRRIILKVGDVLVSRYRNPMFEILEDTCGQHDITFPPCDPVRYERGFGIKNHRSCRTNLAETITDKGVPYAYLPEPINWFQNTPVTPDGTIQRLNSTAVAGDKVVLRALQPVLAVGSACPMIGVNGEYPTDIRFVVRDA